MSDRSFRSRGSPEVLRRACHPSDTSYSWEGDQVALQFDGTEASNLSHRYVWNPAAVDQLLADEQISSPGMPGDVLWPLADQLGTIRDLARHDSVYHTTTVENHRIYDSFGNLVSQSDAAVDELFGFTGRQFDSATGLQYNLNRWYDPKIGHWISEDPMGFAAGDTNLSRYVGNSPTNLTDPSGLHPPGTMTLGGKRLDGPQAPSGPSPQQAYQAAQQKYKVDLLAYYRRIMQQMGNVGDAIWRTNGNLSTLRKQFPEYSWPKDCDIWKTRPGLPPVIEKKGSAPHPFPVDWNRLYSAINYSLQYYDKLGAGSISFTWNDASSHNYFFVPGITLNENNFLQGPYAAIQELVHEPLHDWPGQYGLDLSGFFDWPSNWHTHDTIRNIVGPDLGGKANPDSPFGNNYEQYIDFLRAATGVNGQSLWDQMLKNAGPAPVAPIKP